MLILNIQRMSTEDGPGIRTTLFVKGCPLKCKWCHNPESISFRKQIEWFKVKCIGCNGCIENCPEKALKRNPEGELIIDRERCNLCLRCAEECPAIAIEVKGEEKSVEELFGELIKDKAYFGCDGGITLSGGEILSQSNEAAELLRRLKENGVNTAVDTSGMCKISDIDEVFPYTDLFLYDIKHIDDKKHKELTGQSNGVIIDNFRYLSEIVKGTGKKIWIRTPVIPGATDSAENIKGIARIIKDKADKWELCAFNNLCRDKYKRLYLDWDYDNSPLMTEERMNELVEAAKSEGYMNVIWMGAVRLPLEGNDEQNQ